MANSTNPMFSLPPVNYLNRPGVWKDKDKIAIHETIENNNVAEGLLCGWQGMAAGHLPVP